MSDEPPPQILRRAADLLHEIAVKAPPGPYSLGPEPGYYRQLLANDGDPFAHVRDWPGGIGDDTGSAQDNGAHLRLWTRESALILSEWLQATAQEWPAHTGVTTTEPRSRIRRAALAMALNLLSAHRGHPPQGRP